MNIPTFGPAAMTSSRDYEGDGPPQGTSTRFQIPVMMNIPTFGPDAMTSFHDLSEIGAALGAAISAVTVQCRLQ